MQLGKRVISIYHEPDLHFQGRESWEAARSYETFHLRNSKTEIVIVMAVTTSANSGY